MSEQDKLKAIAEVASNATEVVIGITKALAEHNMFIRELSDLAYQLGYIKGLSRVPEVENESR